MGESSVLVLDGVNTLAFILAISFVAYVVLLVVPLLRRQPDRTGNSRDFEWHFLIPCLNEEAVIGDTVRRLAAQFPAAGIWCVDDASDDATPTILERLEAEFDQVHVVTRQLPEARDGKGPALNAGWLALVDDLSDVRPDRISVAVVDADGRLAPNCLDMVAGPDFLGNDQVGAVQIKVRVVDRSASDGLRRGSRYRRLLVRLQDLEFTGVIAAQQTLRRGLGSAGMGGNGQFSRLSVLNEVAASYGTPWHDSLIEDFELGLHVLLIGHRTQYCHDTWVEQEGICSFRRLVRQRSRWGQGNMDCGRYLRPVLVSRHISTGAALEISYFLLLPWIQLVGSLIFAVALVFFTYNALTSAGGPLAWLGAGGWGVVPLFLIFGIGPLAVWGPLYRRFTDSTVSRLGSLWIGLANWPYTSIHTLATWWAFSRVVRSRHDWKKTERAVPRPVLQPAMFTLETPVVHIALPQLHLVAGTFTRTQRGIEHRRAVGRFRPRSSTTPSSHTERIETHV